MALTLASERSKATGEIEFWIGEPFRDSNFENGWSIAVYANANKRLATFVHSGVEAAWAAHHMLPYVLQDCTLIGALPDSNAS